MSTDRTFTNMKRWTQAKLDKELYFSCPDSPDEMERAWAAAVRGEVARRSELVSA